MKLIFLMIVCYTQTDIKSAICWAMCRRDGGDTGRYESLTNECVCGYKKDYTEYTDTTIRIRPSVEKAKEDGVPH